MGLHGDVRIHADSEASDTADRHEDISADHERRDRNLMLEATQRAPDDLGLPGIQLEAVSPHLQRDFTDSFTDTQRNAALQPGDVTGPAEAVYLRVVSAKMWTMVMILNQPQ